MGDRLILFFLLKLTLYKFKWLHSNCPKMNKLDNLSKTYFPLDSKCFWKRSKKAFDRQFKKMCEYLWNLSNVYLIQLFCFLPNRGCEEASQIQARNCCPPWNQEIPEEHRTSHQETSLPAPGPWDCPGFQDRPEIPECSHWGLTRGQWSLPGWSVWGHKLVRHSRQTSHDHAKGHPTGSTNQGRESIGSEQSMLCLFLKLLCCKFS